ncbi:MAG: nuclear transport factor 2 family protein [Terracidiphilus sp.]
MTNKASLSCEEAADRLAIRALIDAYAHCADTRDAAGQMDLFTEDTQFLVYMDGKAAQPTQVVSGRPALRPVFDQLNVYQATTHFNGQSTVDLDGDSAQGVTYCLAHHITDNGTERSIMIASLRYFDRFRKEAGTWRFAERKLRVDWIDNRPLLG